MMSQPFYYIFAIVVIGLILILGFKYVKDIMSTSCKVENIDLIKDIQTEINEWKSLPSGSGVRCTFTKASGTEYECEFVVSNNVNGVCFVDTSKGQASLITDKFIDIRDTVRLLGKETERNLFFSLNEKTDCKIEPAIVKNLDIPSPVCLDITEDNSFVLESIGNKVQVKIS